MHPKTLLISLLLASTACKKETVTELTTIEGFGTTPVAKSLTPVYWMRHPVLPTAKHIQDIFGYTRMEVTT